MNYFTAEQDIAKVLRESMISAELSSGYKPGNDVGLYIEHVVGNLLSDDKIQDLWGPEWSLFLATVADKIRPEISTEVSVVGVKEVLYKMVGNSNTTPASVLGKKVGLSAGDIDRVMYVFDFASGYHGEIATRACDDLSVPTPVEVTYIYTALGEEATPYMAEKLCKIRPVDCRAIEKSDIPTMAALKDAYL